MTLFHRRLLDCLAVEELFLDDAHVLVQFGCAPADGEQLLDARGVIHVVEAGLGQVVDPVEQPVAEQAAGLGDRGLRLAELERLDDLGAPAQQAAELLFLADPERVACGAEAQQADLLGGLAEEVDRLDEPDHGRAVSPDPAVDERPAAGDVMGREPRRCGRIGQPTCTAGRSRSYLYHGWCGVLKR